MSKASKSAAEATHLDIMERYETELDASTEQGQKRTREYVQECVGAALPSTTMEEIGSGEGKEFILVESSQLSKKLKGKERNFFGKFQSPKLVDAENKTIEADATFAMSATKSAIKDSLAEERTGGFVTKTEFDEYCTETKSATKSIFACMDQVASLTNKITAQDFELRELRLRVKKIEDVMSWINAKKAMQTLDDMKHYNATLLKDQGQKYMDLLKAKSGYESVAMEKTALGPDIIGTSASPSLPKLTSIIDYQALDIIRILSNPGLSTSEVETCAVVCAEYFRKHDMPALAECLTGKELMVAGTRKRIVAAIQRVMKKDT